MDEQGTGGPPAAAPATQHTHTGRIRLDAVLLALVVLVAGAALGYSVFRAAAGGESAPEVRGDIAQVSDGEAVDLQAHLAAGKYTIFDFYADWCPPCRELTPRLNALAAKDPRVAIRKIDVVDWTSPVVAQHHIEGLPHMILFDPSGARIAEGAEVYVMLSKLFQADL
jgi:thiol-disulfide isomerase/thioredoxin